MEIIQYTVAALGGIPFLKGEFINFDNVRLNDPLR